MAGFKPPQLTAFYWKFHARTAPDGRRFDTAVLAELVGASRPAVTRVLNGARRRGPLWPKIARFLTAEEVALLDVAHSSTWNTRRVEKRPRWTPEKAAALTVAA